MLYVSRSWSVLMYGKQWIIKMTMRTMFIRVYFLLGWFTLSGIQQISIAADDQAQVKANYLYKLTSYVKEWPKKEEGDFVFCVVGSQEVGEKLKNIISNKKLKERALRMKYITTAKQTQACEIVFIGKAQKSNIKQFIKLNNILTVSDVDDFAAKGGIISFVEIEGKIRFHLNKTVATRIGLKFSSQFLKLVKKMY